MNSLTKFKSYCQKNHVKENVQGFLYGPVYAPFIMLCSLFFWASGLSLFGLGFVVCLASFVLIFSEDFTPIVPILFPVIMLFRTMDVFFSPWTYLIFAPFIACLVLHYFLYPIKKFKFGKMFLPLVVTLVAYLCGGLFSKTLYAYPKGLGIIIALGGGMLFEYLVIIQQICPPKNIDVKKYFCKTLIWTGLLPCAQMIFILLTEGKIIPQTSLGWGNSNNAGAILLLCTPACFYLMTKAKSFLPYLFVVGIFLISIFLTQSDASLAIICVFTIILAIVTFKQIDEKQRFAYSAIWLTITILGLGALLCWTIIDFTAFEYFVTHKLLSSNGRDELYILAIEHFKDNPIFGGSLGLPLATGIVGNNFHSTLYHLLATLGIFGLVAYVFNYTIRLRILTKKPRIFNFYMFASFVAFDCYALIDTCEFSMLMIYVTALLLFVEKANEQPSELNKMLSRNTKLKSNFIN